MFWSMKSIAFSLAPVIEAVASSPDEPIAASLASCETTRPIATPISPFVTSELSPAEYIFVATALCKAVWTALLSLACGDEIAFAVASIMLVAGSVVLSAPGVNIAAATVSFTDALALFVSAVIAVATLLSISAWTALLSFASEAFIVLAIAVSILLAVSFPAV